MSFRNLDPCRRKRRRLPRGWDTIREAFEVVVMDREALAETDVDRIEAFDDLGSAVEDLPDWFDEVRVSAGDEPAAGPEAYRRMPTSPRPSTAWSPRSRRSARRATITTDLGSRRVPTSPSLVRLARIAGAR